MEESGTKCFLDFGPFDYGALDLQSDWDNVRNQSVDGDTDTEVVLTAVVSAADLTSLSLTLVHDSFCAHAPDIR